MSPGHDRHHRRARTAQGAEKGSGVGGGAQQLADDRSQFDSVWLVELVATDLPQQVLVSLAEAFDQPDGSRGGAGGDAEINR